MAMMMMIVLVAVSLSALLVPMIVTQARTTRFVSSRVQDLDAAQAGIDVALGAVRSAVTSAGVGDSTKLPCAPSTAPMTGSVDATGPAAYTVTIEYFTFDPVTEPTISTNTMKCVAGYGTYTTNSTRITPSYARITATGTVGPATNGSDAGRTLVTSYVFRTSDINRPGGVIQLSPAAAGTKLCMDAGSSTPAAGASPVVQICSTAIPAIAQQVFVYRPDLTIQLASSVTATYLNGLCLVRPAAAGSNLTFSACVPLGSTPSYTQQWSYNDSAAYEASLSTSQTNGVLAGLCMNVAAQTSTPQSVTLATCLNGLNTNPKQSWIPSASVGAGGAAAPQWVNYFEFGRCLEIAGRDPAIDHLIDYPCKQNPYAPAILWNEKFAVPAIPAGQTSATGQVSTVDTDGGANNGKTFCLTSPGTNGAYVTAGGTGPSGSRVANACTTPTAQQTWTIYGGDKSLPYSSRYTIRDYNSLCLGLSTPYAAEASSSVVVETCNGSTEQKWNAPPSLATPGTQNTMES